MSTSTVCQRRPPPPSPFGHFSLSTQLLLLKPRILLYVLLVTVAGQAESDTVSAVPRSSYKHLPCGQKCDRTLLCGHACGKPCHGGSTCPPCTHPCAAKCVHSQCQGRCTDMCAPCAEACPWHCDHQVCHLLQPPHAWCSFMSSCTAGHEYTGLEHTFILVKQGASVERHCVFAICLSICMLASGCDSYLCGEDESCTIHAASV